MLKGNIVLATPEVICTNKLTTTLLNVIQGGEMAGDITHSGDAFISNGIRMDKHTETLAHGKNTV